MNGRRGLEPSEFDDTPSFFFTLKGVQCLEGFQILEKMPTKILQ